MEYAGRKRLKKDKQEKRKKIQSSIKKGVIKSRMSRMGNPHSMHIQENEHDERKKNNPDK